MPKKYLFVALVFTLVLSGCAQQEPALTTEQDTRTLYDKGMAPLSTLAAEECQSIPAHNGIPANTTAEYKNDNLGLSLKIPFNQTWGTKSYKISPADYTNNDELHPFIDFGPISFETMPVPQSDSCYYFRKYSLFVFSLKELEESGRKAAMNFKESTIGGQNVLVSTESFFESQKGTTGAALTIITPKRVYLLIDMDIEKESGAKQQDRLLEIANTITFL